MGELVGVYRTSAAGIAGRPAGSTGLQTLWKMRATGVGLWWSKGVGVGVGVVIKDRAQGSR